MRPGLNKTVKGSQEENSSKCGQRYFSLHQPMYLHHTDNLQLFSVSLSAMDAVNNFIIFHLVELFLCFGFVWTKMQTLRCAR